MSNADENFDRPTKNPWNMAFMQDENDGAQSEDYKISASLKQIWSDVSDDKTVGACSNAGSPQHNVPQGYFAHPPPPPPTEYVQFGNNVIAIAAQSTPVVQPLGTGSHYNTVSNNVNPNSTRRRAITSRNGGHSTQYLGNENRENQPSNNSSVSSIPSNSSLHANSISWAQTLPIEAFLQKVQVIIKNGFLDPKILTEPTAPECFDLCQMLIFYVMEYGKAKVNSNQQEVAKNFYKINLIQTEILRCQEQFIEQNRVQQNILESYAAQEQKQQNFTSPPMSNQYAQSNGKNQWQNVPKALETTSQRFAQRQFDQPQFDQRQVDQRQFDQRLVDQRQYDQRQYDQRQYDQRQYDQRQFDQRQYEQRQYEQQQFEQQQFEQQQFGQRQFAQRQFDQRQLDQGQFNLFPQQPGNAASTSANFAFLPKAKNTDKRSREATRFYAQQDGNFPTN